MVQMSVSTVVSRYWPPAALGAVSTVAGGFAINFLSEGKPGWWWIVLVLSALGLAVSAVWSYALQLNRGGDDARSHSASVAQGDAGVVQQSPVGDGANISITARDESVAAWQIGTVNHGRESNGEKPKTQ
jgi:hypothetical protein